MTATRYREARYGSTRFGASLPSQGENRLAERIARGDTPPNPYVPNLTMRVEFGLRLRDPGDPANQSALAARLN